LWLINQHSKSPNYLLQTNQILTRKQTKEFMAAKLKLDLSEDALDEISKYYYVHHNHHMIDVRRLMNNALSKSFDKKKLAQWKLKSEAPAAANHPSYISPDMCILGNNPIESPVGEVITNESPTTSSTDIGMDAQSADGAAHNKVVASTHAAFVQIHEMPASLKCIRKSKQDIAQLLLSKLVAKSRNNNTLSAMHALFYENAPNTAVYDMDDHDADYKHTKYSTKSKLRQVLVLHDIIVSDEEFDAFFEDFDLKDGTDQFDVRKFLLALLPPDYDDSGLKGPQQQAVFTRQDEIMSSTNAWIVKDRQDAKSLTEKNLGFAELPDYSPRGDANDQTMTRKSLKEQRQAQASGVTMAWMFAGQPAEGPEQWAQTSRRVGSSSSSRPKSASARLGSAASRPSTRTDTPISDNNPLCIVGSRPSTASSSVPASARSGNNNAESVPLSPNVYTPARPTTAPPSSASSRSSKRSSPLVTGRLSRGVNI
jgi:hypothetical protein